MSKKDFDNDHEKEIDSDEVHIIRSYNTIHSTLWPVMRRLKQVKQEQDVKATNERNSISFNG